MTIENHILKAVEGLDCFTAAVLQDRFGEGLHLGRPRLNWYLSKMAETGKIARIGHGIYKVDGFMKDFRPEIGSEAAALYRKFHEIFPEIGMCVYEGMWIFQFMHHLASNRVIYIEVEKDLTETIFHRLRDVGVAAYLRPDADFIYKYVELDKESVFVKSLISESPLMEKDGVRIPTLEKLLVDMCCDSDFFYLQGGEYNRIMRNALSLYNVNSSRLLRYARRRNVSDKIKTIYENCGHDID